MSGYKLLAGAESLERVELFLKLTKITCSVVEGNIKQVLVHGRPNSMIREAYGDSMAVEVSEAISSLNVKARLIEEAKEIDLYHPTSKRYMKQKVILLCGLGRNDRPAAVEAFANVVADSLKITEAAKRFNVNRKAIQRVKARYEDLESIYKKIKAIDLGEKAA